jgi:hypothetical protein
MIARPLVKSGTDPDQVKRAQRTVQQAEEILAASLVAVLQTPAGRYVLWALLESTHVYTTSFDHSGSVMYFREGARNVGLLWRARIVAADPDLYDLMAREARLRDRRLDQQTAAVQDAPPVPEGEQ